ncbi:hypothetical protein [Thiohalophilus thiocyanatoxydans]|nr:hypothetical protein [Thiohalophilus thiocyanatoxydans]
MKLKKFLGYEWDAIAGILAAVIAVILHLLHVVDEKVVLPILFALLGLLFINFMRHTRNNELTAEKVESTAQTVERIQASLKSPDVVLVGPRRLRTVNEHFVRNMSEDTIWFNVCLSMYIPQALFDALLKPAIDNPLVSSIQFVLDTSQKDLWQTLQPRIADCSGGFKVKEPRWCQLSKTTSFILADSQSSGGTEALLSFWGEPFMAQSTEQDVPRFIFHIQKNSELLPHLVELQRAQSRSSTPSPERK